MDARASKAISAHDQILDEISPLTTKTDYDAIVKRVLGNVYREELFGITNDFGGFDSPNQRVAKNGLFEIQNIKSTIFRITNANLLYTARVMVEIQGQLARLDIGLDGQRIKDSYNLKGALDPIDFDFQRLGLKYGFCTNHNLVWDLEKGIVPEQTEKLVENFERVLHDRVTRVGVDEFCTDWLNRSSFELDINVFSKYGLAATHDCFFLINQLSRRESFKYDRKGNLKENFQMPDQLLINPGTVEGKLAIFEVAKTNSEYRGVFNCIELHRMQEENIAMQANAVNEVFHNTESKREIIVDDSGFTRRGKEYLFFNKSGAMGVSGDSGKAVGTGVLIITGKGKGSKRAKILSGNYRGRISCEGYIITCFTDTRPIPPGPMGSRIFRKISMLEEGVRIMAEVERYEYQRLALKIEEPNIGEEFEIGKQVKAFIAHAAYGLRGYNNLDGYDMLDPAVEKSKCFVWQRTNFQTAGRFQLCKCENACNDKTAILRFVGLAVEIVVSLNEANFTLSLQQLIGSKLYRKFTDNFCVLDSVDGHLCYKFKKELLPFQAPIPNASKAIFQRTAIPVKFAERN